MITAELGRYTWNQARWSSDKFIASSPLRSHDMRASFYVWLKDNPQSYAKAGHWGDSGAVDSEWRRGGFVKLLAFLRQETEEETREYLHDTYEVEWTCEEDIVLHPPRLVIESAHKPLDIRLLDQYAFRHPYLERCGVSDVIQRVMRVGYDRSRQAVTLPWFLNGKLANVLYRSVKSKAFWYEKGGWPIRSLLYGMDTVYRRKVKRAALVEAPIDALFLMNCGIPAVAVGGTAFNKEKRDLMIRSHIEDVTLFTDNDAPGEEMKRKAIEWLDGFVSLREVNYPEGCKDPCDVGDRDKIRSMFSTASQIENISKKV